MIILERLTLFVKDLTDKMFLWSHRLTGLDPCSILWESTREVPLKKYKITIREHEESSELGLVVNNRDYFDPALSGFVVAHDIMEHTIKQHSCKFTDELMALGGFVAGRVNMPYYDGYRYASIDDMEADLVDLMKAALNEEGDDNSFTRIDKCRSYISCSQTMSEIKNITEKCIIKALKEWEGDSSIDDYDIKSIVGWICKGHHLFKRRFKGINTYNLFNNIKEAADKFLSNQVELNGTLYVNFSTGLVYIDTDWDEY
jgi:hypothetical protein